jgi:hypothetical protein
MMEKNRFAYWCLRRGRRGPQSTLPNTDKVISNTRSNWKSYSPSEKIGNLAPSLIAGFTAGSGAYLHGADGLKYAAIELLWFG